MSPTRSTHLSALSDFATATSSMKPQPRPSHTEGHHMLLIECPYCGRRPELGFVSGREAHIARPDAAAQLTDAQWTDYLYARGNTRGVHAERWRHTRGCGRFFNALS